MRRGLMQWHPMMDVDQFFDNDFLSGGFAPAMDVYQEGDNVIVNVSLPDIDPEKVNVSVENDVLTVTGTMEEKNEVKREDYYHKEIRKGSFSRSVVLPMQVKGEETQAVYEKGVLKITLPKAEEAKPKKIAVKVSGK